MFHIPVRMPVAGSRAIFALVAFGAVALVPLLAEIK